MGFIDLDKPSAFEVLETTPRGSRTNTWAIIQRKYDYSGDTGNWEILVPDAGAKPFELLKMYRDRERSKRIETNNREQEFRDSLKEPHSFIRESRDTLLCYCGELKEHDIHVGDDDATL